MDNVNLRGIILSKYPSIGAFAKAIGWSASKARRIANEIQEPSQKDASEMVICLNLSKEQFLALFYPSMFTNSERKAS